MDEEAVSADQASRLRRALEAAELPLSTVWMHYFRLGGNVSEMEIDAYLHHALSLPALERDLLAHALSELADGHHVPHIPLSSDYRAPDGSLQSLDEGPAARPEGPAEGSAAEEDPAGDS